MASIFKRFGDIFNKQDITQEPPLQYPPQYQELLNSALKKANSDIEVSDEILFKDELINIIHDNVKAINTTIQTEFMKRFYHEKLFVVLFTLDDYENLFKDDDKINDTQRISSLKLITSNIFKEFIHSIGGIGYFLEVGKNYICIVNISKIYSRMNILSVLKQTKENIYNYFNVKIKSAISSEVHGFPHLYRGYNEAIVATEYFKIDNSSTVLSFADMAKNKHDPEYYDIPRSDKDNFNEIFLCISNSNFEESKRLISELIKTYLNSFGISFVSFKFITYEIAINLINEFNEYINNEKFINDIFRHKTIPIDEIIILVNHICDNIKEDKLSRYMPPDKKEVLVNEIVKYIETNYDDMDLNIAKLAENFDYVPSYISKIFKSIKNVSLIDFINRKRVEEAKHLLLNTDKVLNDIAAKTGFCSDAALIRIFKKYEGTTPIAYKKDYYKINNSK